MLLLNYTLVTRKDVIYMRIEKISDNQIRCTLNKNDLLDRELRISELAYGTEKAKALFRDMMQQASYEFGFEADDIPLMIEAIPVSPECLILVITKVEDPDELDTRFSKFSSNHETAEYDINDTEDSYADEIINCFGQLDELLEEDDEGEQIMENSDIIPLPDTLSQENEVSKDSSPEKIDGTSVQTDLTKVYSFYSLAEIIKLANHVASSYNGINSVYKNLSDGIYYLVIRKSEHTPEDFNKVCNIISEYGKAERTTYATLSYYQEHFELITKDTALQILSNM